MIERRGRRPSTLGGHPGARRRRPARAPAASGCRSSARTAPASRRCCAASPALVAGTGDAAPRRAAGRRAAPPRAGPARGAGARRRRSIPAGMHGRRLRAARPHPAHPPARRRGRRRPRRRARRPRAPRPASTSPTARSSTLSGGERQRVLIARALAQGAPSCCSTSRPPRSTSATSSRCSSSSTSCRREHGLTVVTTMHDLTLAGQYADRLVLLDGGRVGRRGHGDEVLTEENLATLLRRQRAHHPRRRPARRPARSDERASMTEPS